MKFITQSIPFIFLFFLFTTMQVSGQIVNIPDPEFKQALLDYSPNIDTNNDNEIQVTEAEAITSLTITDYQYFMDPGFMDPVTGDMFPGFEVFGISDFTGIEAFINLTYLDCARNDITTLNVSALTQLTYLDCSSNINFNASPEGGTGIDTINLPASNTLVTLNTGTNALSGVLDLSSYTNLSVLNVSSNQINTLTLPTSNSLTNIISAFNPLGALTLNTNTGLINLDCRSNQLSNLDTSQNILLTTLNADGNQLTALDLSQNSELVTLKCNSNSLTDLDVTQNEKLATIECRNNAITAIDVTRQRTALTRLYCQNNNLSSLNLKNGNNTALTNFNFNTTNNPDLTLICVDDITYASNTFNNINSQMFFAQDCSFIPSMSNTITGTIAYDFDMNGCDASDASDVKSANTKITTLGSNTASTTFSANNGTYTLYTFDASTNTSITPNFPSFFDVTPVTQSSTFIGTGNTEVIDYCITANSVVNDVEIQVFSIEEARPGFDTSVRILYRNSGSTILSGNFDFTYEDDKQTLLSTSVAPTTQVGNMLTWTYTNLQPFETGFVDVVLNTNPPTDPINPVNNGDTLTYTTSITPTTGDANPSNNSDTLVGITIGSYDPNDITIKQGDQITAAQALEFLNFRIRFQNTGTASAINIRIETILDADLDWDTFEPISASDSYRTSLTDNNKVEFFFENINLPDSTTDEPGSNGWVFFKVKPKAGFDIGDLVEAKADIFFDFNFPIITNTATTEIPSTFSATEFSDLSLVTMFPNPAKDKLSITTAFDADYSVYGINGQLYLKGNLQSGENQINISTIANGIYFIKLNVDDKLIIKKLIKN